MHTGGRYQRGGSGTRSAGHGVCAGHGGLRVATNDPGSSTMPRHSPTTPALRNMVRKLCSAVAHSGVSAPIRQASYRRARPAARVRRSAHAGEEPTGARMH
ncbi:hypothetical protein [Azospirillum doebereinerae]